jgi:hypothetical protein
MNRSEHNMIHMEIIIEAERKRREMELKGHR